MNNKKVAPSATLTIGELVRMQEHIADQLDHFNYCFQQSLGGSIKGKVPVVFLGVRYAAIGNCEFTPDELQEALELIEARRKVKSDKKLMGGTVLNDTFIQPDAIQPAKLGNSITNTSFSIRAETVENGKHNVPGISSGWTLDKVGVFEGTKAAAKIQEEAEARRAASNSLRIDATSFNVVSTKIKLSDEMHDAVVDAIRNSSLYESLRTELSGQVAALASLQQAIHGAVNDAIRNALKPGGVLYSR